jgi:hypothetical protein
MSAFDKNVVALGMNQLPEAVRAEILAMVAIQADVGLTNDYGEVEVDFDSLPLSITRRMHELCLLYLPNIEEETRLAMAQTVDGRTPFHT